MSVLINGLQMPEGRPVCIVIDAAGQARRYDLNNDRYADDKLFEAVPAADVRLVVRGRWVEFEPDTLPRRNGCSECGFITNPWLAHVYNFCPNCGADMRGET